MDAGADCNARRYSTRTLPMTLRGLAMLRPYATLAMRPRCPVPIRAHIDLAAMRHNLAAHVRARPVARSGRSSRPMRTAMASSVRCRDSRRRRPRADRPRARRAGRARRGWARPMLLLEGMLRCRATCRRAANSDLPLSLHHDGPGADARNCVRRRTPVDVYIKLNTGMNRLGFVPDELPRVSSATRARAGGAHRGSLRCTSQTPIAPIGYAVRWR